MFEVEVGGLNVGMDRDLWGISLWIWHYLMGMSIYRLSKNGKKNQFFLEKLCKLARKMESINLRGNCPKLLLKLASCALGLWYMKNRRHAFTYGSTLMVWLYVLGLCVLFLMII